jgi:hypothetical protein
LARRPWRAHLNSYRLATVRNLATALAVGSLIAVAPAAGASSTGSAVETPQGLWYDPANSNALLQSFAA